MIGLSRLVNVANELVSVATVVNETMAIVWCFCLSVDYQNCLCPDRSSGHEFTNNCAPPKKNSLSLNHRWKGKKCCADGSRNKENYARFHF